MAQSKILLDSNAYFRLAYSKHPLLFASFGKENYTLYVIEDLQKEFDYNPRLQNKFDWVNQKKFIENRKCKLNISKKDKRNIEITYSFLWEYNISEEIGASPVDVKALAVGSVLGIPVVTDDADMISLGKAFNINVLGILELLKLMFDCGHVDITELNAIIGYLEYTNDLPYGRFIEDFKKVFDSS